MITRITFMLLINNLKYLIYIDPFKFILFKIYFNLIFKELILYISTNLKMDFSTMTNVRLKYEHRKHQDRSRTVSNKASRSRPMFKRSKMDVFDTDSTTGFLHNMHKTHSLSPNRQNFRKFLKPYYNDLTYGKNKDEIK